MKLNIRRATSDDIGDIVTLWGDLNEDQIGKDPYYEGPLQFSGGNEQYRHALSNEQCAVFVGEVDGKIIGYIEVWIHEPDFYFYSAKYGYILHFFVKEKYRNATSAYKFYMAAQAYAEEVGVRYLAADVFEHNQRVVKLLEFVGLKPYRYRMVKDLEGAKA